MCELCLRGICVSYVCVCVCKLAANKNFHLSVFQMYVFCLVYLLGSERLCLKSPWLLILCIRINCIYIGVKNYDISSFLTLTKLCLYNFRIRREFYVCVI